MRYSLKCAIVRRYVVVSLNLYEGGDGSVYFLLKYIEWAEMITLGVIDMWHW